MHKQQYQPTPHKCNHSYICILMQQTYHRIVIIIIVLFVSAAFTIQETRVADNSEEQESEFQAQWNSVGRQHGVGFQQQQQQEQQQQQQQKGEHQQQQQQPQTKNAVQALTETDKKALSNLRSAHSQWDKNRRVWTASITKSQSNPNSSGLFFVIQSLPFSPSHLGLVRFVAYDCLDFKTSLTIFGYVIIDSVPALPHTFCFHSGGNLEKALGGLIEDGNQIDSVLVAKEANFLNTGRFDKDDQKEAAGMQCLAPHIVVKSAHFGSVWRCGSVLCRVFIISVQAPSPIC